MVDSPIGPLRAQYDAIAHKLDATAPGAQREAVKREIIAYFKQVDSLISELGELKEDIRKLVDRYKQLVGRATDKNFGQLYIDLTAVREMIEKVAPSGSLGAYERDYKPYLVPFDAIAGSTWTDGGLIRGRFIIGTNK